jgi:OFA family oxalate/formate antiporter-like MFS transporter
MINKRWGVAIAAVIVQMALGAVYAWSVFSKPLAHQFHWNISQVTLAFTIAIFVVGFAAFFGGLWSNHSGPRVVAMTGGLLYGAGVALASFSDHGLWVLYLTYGVIGGIGIGLGYIIPIAVLVRWFPDKRGLMTGIAVGGFGAGALITAPIATRLIQSVGVLDTFLYLGIAYLIVGVVCGYFMQNPPEGYTPPGWQPSPMLKKTTAAGNFTLGQALESWQWWVLWLLLFLNTSAGISIISQESPMFQTFAGVTALAAAGMIGIASFGNGAGRIFWAWISDMIPRRFVFLIMFLLQAVLFWVLPDIHSKGVLTVATFIILLCYGGGFGTMPAFAADYFGPKYVGQVYGLMLTAWGFASAFGPLLIAHTLQTTGHYEMGLHILAVVLLVSAVLPFMVRPPRLPDVAVGSGTGGVAIAH